MLWYCVTRLGSSSLQPDGVDSEHSTLRRQMARKLTLNYGVECNKNKEWVIHLRSIVVVATMQLVVVVRSMRRLNVIPEG
jgi:hypothetical protein